MGDTTAPIGIGKGVGEVVVVAVPMSVEIAVQLAARLDRHGVAGIGTCYIQSHRVKGREHPYIGNNGKVVFRASQETCQTDKSVLPGPGGLL